MQGWGIPRNSTYASKIRTFYILAKNKVNINPIFCGSLLDDVLYTRTIGGATHTLQYVLLP